MNYDLLRRRLLDAVAFDSIYVKRELLKKYFDRIDKIQRRRPQKPGQKAEKKEDTTRRVIDDFFEKYVANRVYVVKFGNEYRKVRVGGVMKGKILSAIRPGGEREYYKMIKQMLVCLASLDEAILYGEKSKPFPSDPEYKTKKGKRESPKHENSLWIYVKNDIQDRVLGGNFIVQIELRAEHDADKVYHLIIEGGKRFDERLEQMGRNMPKNSRELVRITLA